MNLPENKFPGVIFHSKNGNHFISYCEDNELITCEVIEEDLLLAASVADDCMKELKKRQKEWSKK